MKSKLIFFFLFIQCSFMSAQTFSINSVEVCAGQEVLVPAVAGNLALSIFLTPVSFDNKHFQSIAINQNRTESSDLSIHLLSTSVSAEKSTWTCKNNISGVYVPCFDFTAIAQAISENGCAMIRMKISGGQFISETDLPEKFKGLHHNLLDTSDRHPEVYFEELTLSVNNVTLYQLV